MGYTITFFDRAERKYQLLIDGGGTALDGGAVTFETQEDAGADMFMPMRCQTGTFRYIGHNDHATWQSMIPADAIDKRVVLQRYDNNAWVTFWQGYIQPQVFENEYPGRGTVEHDFAVQCPLSVLDTMDIDPNPNDPDTNSRIVNQHPTVTFGELLQNYVFHRVTSTGTATKNTYIRYIYIQGYTAVVAQRLGLKVMWGNFLETDSNNNVVCKYTCKQVLGEFCKFFGYTCRMHGDCVYFTQASAGNVGFSRYSTLTGSPTAIQRSTFALTDAMFANTDDHEEVHAGIGKATVKSNINQLANLVEIPYDELYDQYNTGVPADSIIIRALDQGDEKIYYLIKTPDSNGATLTYENDTVAMSCYMAKIDNLPPDPSRDPAPTFNKYCRFLTFDSSEVGDPETQEIPESKKAYGWVNCVELFHGTEYAGSDSTTMFTIASKQVFVISDGILYISWKMRDTDAGQYKQQIEDYPPTLTAQLRVGTKYWTGRWNRSTKQWVDGSWTDDPSTFTMYLDSDGPKTTRNSANAPQYDGCGIPVSDTMRGILEFKIIDVQTWKAFIFEQMRPVDNNGFVPMHDFAIGFVRGTIEDTKHRGNEYTSQGGKFRDEINVDLIWASDVTYGTGSYTRHMPAGLGYILDSSTEKPAALICSMAATTGTPDVIPEQYLASIIANYGQATHRLVQMNLRSSSLGDVEPTAVSSGLESGMFPLAISHNWRDDITTLTLIQL